MRDIKTKVYYKHVGGAISELKQNFNPSDGFRWKEEGQPVIIAWFINRKDKNGQDIYEGDVLDFDEKEWRGKFTPEVVPTIDKLIGEWPLCGSLSDVEQFRSVIGNIHSNPELLEDKK